MSNPVDTPTPVAPQPSGTPASPTAGGASPAAANGAAVSDAAVSDELARLTDEIVTAIKTVYDPEIPADVYELGLIYKIDIADDRAVRVEMTLTTPNCPSAQELPTMVENAVASVPGVGPVDVKVVWDPPWEPSRMSDEARVVLNMW
jgi:FeS assembly SUF system protein